MDQKCNGWLKAIERRRDQIEKLGIQVPAIAEIILEGTRLTSKRMNP